MGGPTTASRALPGPTGLTLLFGVALVLALVVPGAGYYPMFVLFLTGPLQALLTRRLKHRPAPRPRRYAGSAAQLGVGASAGLCLFPDRYRYDYGRGVVGDNEGPVLARGCAGRPRSRVPSHRCS